MKAEFTFYIQKIILETAQDKLIEMHVRKLKEKYVLKNLVEIKSGDLKLESANEQGELRKKKRDITDDINRG